MTQSHNIFQSFLSFYLRVSCYHTQSCARRVKQATVELFEHIRQLTPVLTWNHAVCNTEAVHVGIKRLKSLFLHIISDKYTWVFHQLSDVRGFTTWRCGHIQDALIWLRRKSHNWQKRAWTLQNVMACKILRRRANRDLWLLDFQTYFGPFSYWVETYSSLN